MLIHVIISIFEKPFSYSYKILDQYLITNCLAFVKGFELALVMIIAVVFLLVAVDVMLRQARRLPKSYIIEVTDLDDMSASVDGLRQTFSTYDAAESYARFYRKMHAHQYKFKVVGRR